MALKTLQLCGENTRNQYDHYAIVMDILLSIGTQTTECQILHVRKILCRALMPPQKIGLGFLYDLLNHKTSMKSCWNFVEETQQPINTRKDQMHLKIVLFWVIILVTVSPELGSTEQELK